ncbi:MAG: hypothetical protein U0165_07400 [Polyangiaceae bacterium]
MLELIPEPHALPAGSWIAIEATERVGRWSLRRLVQKPRFIHRALRCTALLARGYEHVGAGTDQDGRDIAWGRVPSSPPMFTVLLRHSVINAALQHE